MHLTRDTLLLADDAAPDRVAESGRRAGRGSIVRLCSYNGEVRDRLDREGNLQRSTPPRGDPLIVSAEIGPSATSAVQRTLIVPFIPGLISRDTRVSLWEAESRHGRAVTMASFIRWQAGPREAILARTAELITDNGQAWTDAGHSERTAEALAHLAAGWRLMLDHLTEAGAYTDSECTVIWEAAWAGLDEAGRTQANPDEPADAAGKILARLRTGLLGRYGYLTSSPDGAAPHPKEAARYGWTVDTVPSRNGIPGGEVTVVNRPHGADPVGCYAGDGDQRRLWLVPELTLIMLRKVCDRLGEPFEETVMSVSSALEQAGIGLAVTEVPSPPACCAAPRSGPCPAASPGRADPGSGTSPSPPSTTRPPDPATRTGRTARPRPQPRRPPRTTAGPATTAMSAARALIEATRPAAPRPGRIPPAARRFPAGRPGRPRPATPAGHARSRQHQGGPGGRHPAPTRRMAARHHRRGRQPAPSPAAARPCRSRGRAPRVVPRRAPGAGTGFRCPPGRRRRSTADSRDSPRPPAARLPWRRGKHRTQARPGPGRPAPRRGGHLGRTVAGHRRGAGRRRDLPARRGTAPAAGQPDARRCPRGPPGPAEPRPRRRQDGAVHRAAVADRLVLRAGRRAAAARARDHRGRARRAARRGMGGPSNT